MEIMEGAGTGRRGDAVKDAWVKVRWKREKKQKGRTEEQRERDEGADIIDLSCFYRFFSLHFFPSL